MVPCWNAKPERRPGFAELQRTLVELGAVDSSSEARRSSIVANGSATAALSPEEERLLLGPSVHHMGAVLLPMVHSSMMAAGAETPELATVRDMVKHVVISADVTKTCPRDGKPGCAYVDLLTGPEHVGRSNALLSCKYFR